MQNELKVDPRSVLERIAAKYKDVSTREFLLAMAAKGINRKWLNE
jgi:hypothetical protein